MKNNQYTATPNWFDKVQQTNDSVSTGNTYVTNFGSIQQQSGLTDLVIEITGEEDGNGLSPEVSWNKEESKLSFVKTKFLKEGDPVVDADYVTTIADNPQDILSNKDFINGLSINKHRFFEKDGILYLDGDLAVTGGITTFATAGKNISTIMDGIVADEVTITVAEKDGIKQLQLKEGVGGGLTSVIITGTGNAVTDASLEDEGKTLNLKKDKTFLIPNDLLGYAKEDWVTNQLQNYVTLNTEQDITAIKNFLEGITIGSSKKKFYEKDGVVYIDANLAVTGGITQYAVDPANVSDLMDNIRTDGTTIRVNPDTKELEVIGGIGIDLSAMWDALSASTSEQINHSHLTTALQGYATESWANSNFPTKTGSGASGTWGINISGTAANANKVDNVSNGNLTSRYWNPTSPVDDLNNYRHNGFAAWSTVSANKPYEYGTLFQFSNQDNPKAGTNDHWVNQIAFGTNNRIYTRQRINTGVWSSWSSLAYLSDNVYSATKLQTPRTIWGNNFDGTANVSGELSSVTGIRFSAGERFDRNGNIILPSTDGTYNWNVFNSSGNAAFKVYANGLADIYIAKIGEYLLYQNEATLKIYSDYNPSSPTEYGKETTCLQTSFDGQDPTTSTYPGLYPGRCVLALQPRGGWVGIGLRNPTTVLDVNGDIQANGWVRTKGNVGWYAQDWGGGWYMSDSTYIRTYNNKAVVALRYDADQGLSGSFWNNGDAAFSVRIHNNENQTPLLLAYRNSTADTGENRLFALELLNSGKQLAFGMGGKAVMSLSSHGGVECSSVTANYDNSGWDDEYSIYYSSFWQNKNVINYSKYRYILGWEDSCPEGWNTGYGIGTYRSSENEWGSMIFEVCQYEDTKTRKAQMELRGKDNTLWLSGNILAIGGITQYSDQRAKTIIEQINLSLMDIANSPAIRFKWNGYKDRKDDGKTHVGGIAQYIQKILPEVIYNSDDLLTMDYATTGYIFAVNTAKHLLDYETKTDKEISKLKSRIKYLEKQLKKLGYEEANIMDN